MKITLTADEVKRLVRRTLGEQYAEVEITGVEEPLHILNQRAEFIRRGGKIELIKFARTLADDMFNQRIPLSPDALGNPYISLATAKKYVEDYFSK